MSSQRLFFKELSCASRMVGSSGEGRPVVHPEYSSDKINKGLVTGKYDASCSLWQSPKIMNLSKVHKDLLLFSQLWIFLNLSWSSFYSQHTYTALRVKYVYFYIKQQFLVFVQNSSSSRPWVLCPKAVSPRCPWAGLPCTTWGVLSSFVHIWGFLLWNSHSSGIVLTARRETWNI